MLLSAVSLILSSCFVYAQNLSLNNAVNKAIENNFQVKILSNQVEIAELSNTYGNAGGLPLISGNVNQNFTLNNIQQELSSGVTINQKNATGNSFNSNLNAGILVFNGFKVRASKAKFEELVKQNKLILEDEILELKANVNAAYYKVLEAQELQNQYTKNLNLATRKKDLIQARINAGYANEADLLQVQIEWNNLKTIIDLQNTNIATAKKELLLVMAEHPSKVYELTDTLAHHSLPAYSDLEAKLNSTSLLNIAESSILIQRKIQKEIEASKYPAIRLNGSYNFNRIQNSAGFNLVNQNYGPAIGLSMNIPIYNGGVLKNQSKIAALQYENLELQKNLLYTQLLSQLATEMERHDNLLRQCDEQNLTLEKASRLIEIMLTKFQLNQSTILDLNLAQQTYENAVLQSIQLNYAAKMSEIKIRRLADLPL